MLKSFVAARCARWQVRLELGASLGVLELEKKIAILEKEKIDLEASLLATRAEAAASSKLIDEARR